MRYKSEGEEEKKKTKIRIAATIGKKKVYGRERWGSFFLHFDKDVFKKGVKGRKGRGSSLLNSETKATVETLWISNRGFYKREDGEGEGRQGQKYATRASCLFGVKK